MRQRFVTRVALAAHQAVTGGGWPTGAATAWGVGGEEGSGFGVQSSETIFLNPEP
jgi:hypothetical protein